MPENVAAGRLGIDIEEVNKLEGKKFHSLVHNNIYEIQ